LMGRAARRYGKYYGASCDALPHKGNMSTSQAQKWFSASPS